MKKILVINTLYSPHIGGGAEIMCQELSEALAKYGYHVAVLTTGPKGSGLVIDYINGITVYRAGIRNQYWQYEKKQSRVQHFLWHVRDSYNFSMQPSVEAVIQREHPDIALCHNMTGFSISAWAVLKKHQIPIIEVLHDQYMRCPNSNATKKGMPCKGQCVLCRVMRMPHRMWSDKVDAVVGVSHYVLNSLTQLGYFSKSKQYVIHNARKIAEPKTYLTWDGVEPLRIGYIGTLSKVKGVEWLIRSFMNLDMNATLTIAGKGETAAYEDELKALAASDSRIRFSGYVKSDEHYKNIHLSVIPSLWPDTFPTVAFESCAYHVPVIATNRGGLPEIIKDGVNGIIINPSSQEVLENAILKLYDNPSYLGVMARKSYIAVSSLLEYNRWVNDFISIVDNLLYRKHNES